MDFKNFEKILNEIKIKRRVAIKRPNRYSYALTCQGCGKTFSTLGRIDDTKPFCSKCQYDRLSEKDKEKQAKFNVKMKAQLAKMKEKNQ